MKNWPLGRQLAQLRMLNERGQLALFVGAGVSFGCGLPTWDQLIDRLIGHVFPNNHNIRSALEGQSTINKARILKGRLKGGFNRVLADCLYAEPYTISSGLEAITRSGIRRVCTFNFDDLLEECAQTEGINFNSVEAGDRLNSNFMGTIIFHPHGLLTPTMSADDCRAKRIIFSEEDYNKLYSDPYSWANISQLALLFNYTCVFVGISFRDPNLRRLLDLSVSLGIRNQHYAVMRSPLYAAAEWEKPLARQIKQTLRLDFDMFRINPIWIRRFTEIQDVFTTIRNNKESWDITMSRDRPILLYDPQTRNTTGIGSPPERHLGDSTEDE